MSMAGAWRIELPAQGWAWPAEAGDSLLQSAEAAGVILPSSCRNGTCRACLCQLLSGQVRYRIEWPGLSAEEKAEGWILPCVAEPVADCALAVPAAHRAVWD
ncbi:2Fe-2S iron-sulfur cluster-binding protein [Curvibacter sp. HBC61]|uniref:2Fe-2S iron-sulfur cluster-binding protein n=1 Tax=Curvibacter cyanobacteriorum TaxID=3026422 RepID=A0ABT5N078_9BURK|nr:2Fe-2S iron-sulfur cluster-binding protein [Curvibacter sp. HBC61]MDD0839051.1 2Fe-2S iron-sulfur cluster-binding protein [Curvibacter sp. HBC61]